jgi:hypothetical protein
MDPHDLVAVESKDLAARNAQTVNEALVEGLELLRRLS